MTGKTRIGSAGVIAAALALTGCSPQASRPGAVGMANPASVYCKQIGGTLEIRSEAAGQVGYCHLPDGRVVEEWTLFRSARR